MADDPLAIFSAITSDSDVWATVLSFLPLSSLKIASSTSHAHRALLPLARIQALVLELSFKPSIDAAPTASSLRPSPLLRIREPPHDEIVLLPAIALLPAIVGSYPSLYLLDVNASPPSDGANKLAQATLHETTSALHLRPPAPTSDGSVRLPGPLPWAVLPTRRLGCLKLRVCHPGDGRSACKAERAETAEALRAIFLSCTIAAVHSLTMIDLTGVGPAVLSVLVQLELPRLTTLRLGEERCLATSVASLQAWRWPAATLFLLGHAFPTLEGVDVGYAAIDGGVAFRDVELLCTACAGLRHLDLSMVMTLRDFGPALRLLAKHAPNLISLAVHGLDAPPDALVELANGCPHLSTAHFVRCRLGSDGGLITFLHAASSLTALDLTQAGYRMSPTCFPDVDFLQWLSDRHDAHTPVRYLALSRGAIDTPTFEVNARAISPDLELRIFNDEWSVPDMSDEDMEVRTRLFPQTHALLSGSSSRQHAAVAAALRCHTPAVEVHSHAIDVSDVQPLLGDGDEGEVTPMRPRRPSLDMVSSFV